MKHLLVLTLRLKLLIVCGCFVSWASAQRPSLLDSMATQLRSSDDTTRAIHRLFLTKRRSATAITLSGIGFAGSGVLMAQLSYAIVNAVKTANGAKSLDEGSAGSSIKLSLPGLFITTLGVIKRARFSRRREEKIVAAYEQGEVIPFKIQSALRPRHFAN